MNATIHPAGVYHQHIADLNKQLGDLRKKKNVIAWARLITIIAAIAAGYNLYSQSLAITSVVVLVLLTVFIRLVALAVNNKTAIDNINRLIAVNQQEIAIAHGNYLHLPDGSSLAPADHDYAHDLDIFGRASVYQYINRTTSQQGNLALAAWLLRPADTETILHRQEAAKELASQFHWRQQLQAHGMEQLVTVNTANKIKDWLQQPDTFSGKSSWRTLRWMYPVITLSILVLYIAGIVPAAWFYGSIILFLGFSSFVSKLVTPQYILLNKIVNEVDVLSKGASWIEKNNFKSAYLQQLQQFFKGTHRPASQAIRQLKSILDMFDYRLNPLVFIPVNTFILWDLQLICKLEKWRDEHKVDTPAWFEALGQTEAISTLAALHFNHPGWAFPAFTQQHGTLETDDIGHPLIAADKRVTSSFHTKGEAQLALITGSNMAGKSTFLRSIGVNVVLATAGAPVCAARMTLAPMRIISSMRVADNLEESTSTFYAELKKLKRIIDEVNNHEKIFLLLDEILRGTNSLDRHTGSKALIKQLIEHKAVGMLATHDLDLAKLAGDYPANIHNYHFDVQVAGEELYFDYKLKDGICNSLNASILMKKIGIEIG